MSWLIDGKAISESADFRMERAGGVVRLVITEVYPDDEGKYACVAMNAAGEERTSCVLIVKGDAA